MKKPTSFLLRHIGKLREELQHKNKVIKATYEDLINEKLTDNFKIILAGNRLAVELRQQSAKDTEFIKRINQLFIDEGEKPPFDIKATEGLLNEFLKKQPFPSLED